MFFLLKVFLAATAFSIRILSSRFRIPRGNVSYEDGVEFRIFSQYRRDNKPAFKFAECKLPSRFTFTLSPESGFDRFFKSIGLAEEQTTGDVLFDKSVYIACDHPQLLDVLKHNQAMRSAVLEAFKFGAGKIKSDGFYLTINMRDAANIEIMGMLMVKLAKTFASLEKSRSTFVDTWAERAMVVEGLAWAVFVYGISGYFEALFRRRQYFLEAGSAIHQGMILGAVVAAVSIGAILLLFRRSSLGHRILIQCAFLLVIGFPTGALTIVKDIDIELDNAPPITAFRRVDNKFEVVNRGPSGKNYEVSYFLILSKGKFSDDNLPIAQKVEVDPQVYFEASPGSTAEITVGRGRLGYMWYRDFQFGSH